MDPSLIFVINHGEPSFESSPPVPCSPFSVRSFPEMILLAVQAAIDGHLCAELASIESLIFNTFLGWLCSLHVYTVYHVPCMAKPLLAFCLCHELSLVDRQGLWGFVHLLMFAKLVFRTPPHAGRNKCCLIARLTAT